MNSPFRTPVLRRTTQAAEGLMRRRWSVAEIVAMVEAGILLEDERFELIGGEVVPMSPKGNRHELLKGALNEFWAKRMPASLRLVPETTFYINEDTFLEPDFVFYRKSDGLVNLTPATALLAVEVSDSSLDYDLGRKSHLYAVHGVRQVWIVDAVKLETHIRRLPGLDGYGEKLLVPPDAELVPDFAPELAVKLGELELV